MRTSRAYFCWQIQKRNDGVVPSQPIITPVASHAVGSCRRLHPHHHRFPVPSGIQTGVHQPSNRNHLMDHLPKICAVSAPWKILPWKMEIMVCDCSFVRAFVNVRMCKQAGRPNELVTCYCTIHRGFLAIVMPHFSLFHDLISSFLTNWIIVNNLYPSRTLLHSRISVLS